MIKDSIKNKGLKIFEQKINNYKLQIFKIYF